MVQKKNKQNEFFLFLIFLQRNAKFSNYLKKSTKNGLFEIIKKENQWGKNDHDICGFQFTVWIFIYFLVFSKLFSKID